MKNKIILASLLLPLSIVGASIAQASDILSVPSTVPLEEKGMAWEHPSATINGEGDLEFENKGANIPVDVSYEGIISCEVSISAATHYQNKVEFEMEDFGREVEAKSKVGTLNISDCTVTDENGDTSAITETATITGGKVEVEIEGLYEDVSGALKFSEYEAEGKVENGNDLKVKLDLKSGMITMPVTPPPTGGGGGACIPPDCI